VTVALSGLAARSVLSTALVFLVAGALGLIAAGAHFLVGLDWTTSLLVGAILAGGDSGGGASASSSTLAFDRRFLEEVDQVAERENSAHNALGAVQIQHLAVSLESVPGCRERGQAAAVQE
jgi:NhaP-type Na+/H+ and K+/H+ antiporter